jgi:hypothetical protein
VTTSSLSRGRTIAAALALLAVGCGGPKASEDPTPEERMPPAPQIVADECAVAARTYDGTVYCPVKLPASRAPMKLEFGGRARTTRSTWQLGLQLRGSAFHVLVGGQRRPLPLATDGDRWPRDRSRVRPQLGLVGTGALTPGDAAGTDAPSVRPVVVRDDVYVRGARALLLAFGAYPGSGTIHGGHQALVWNEGGEGVLVSAHFDEDVPSVLRLRLLRAVAESMRPVR